MNSFLNKSNFSLSELDINHSQQSEHNINHYKIYCSELKLENESLKKIVHKLKIKNNKLSKNMEYLLNDLIQTEGINEENVQIHKNTINNEHIPYMENTHTTNVYYNNHKDDNFMEETEKKYSYQETVDILERHIKNKEIVTTDNIKLDIIKNNDIKGNHINDDIIKGNNINDANIKKGFNCQTGNIILPDKKDFNCQTEILYHLTKKISIARQIIFLRTQINI
ncbi:hypothetical protein PFFVO_04118 [Plasmodium falciparum Vietnam Oak-Knoll (FVO)]|uniref:Uncharacterized protein n=1 Tax=Plasmodium falciparum Vietnam Oak-Knoll (FVO) TaxID=1036723 RepID=A0A024V1X9_PLAFA|nr:hypothetical protein PFFVO_04118 [Plasmodium falciparum Vietnam Oak-Knoll (FVO)]